jgi:hypothetical protein
MTEPTRRIGIARIGITVALLVLGLGLEAAWSGRLAALPPISYAADDPALPMDGFYPAEPGEGGVRFRWSRPAAGVLLPAWAARQTVTLEMTAPRPDGSAPPHRHPPGSQRRGRAAHLRARLGHLHDHRP